MEAVVLPLAIKAFCTIFIGFIGVLLAQVIVPFIQAFGPWLTNWIEIPGLSVFILWGQAIAVVAAIAIRAGVGIRDMLMSSGGEARMGLGEYVFKSVVSIALVGLMPTLCSLVIWFGQRMAADVVGPTVMTLDNLQMTVDVDKVIESITTNDPTSALALLCYVILDFVAFGFVVTIVYQLLKRQFQMLFLSVAAPWIGIKAATETDSSTYWEFLQSLFGMCVVQWLQYLGMIVGLSMISSTIGMSFDIQGVSLGSATFINMILVIAAFGAALGIPALVDRWTFSAPGAHSGSMLIGMAVRRGLSGPNVGIPKTGPAASDAKAKG